MKNAIHFHRSQADPASSFFVAVLREKSLRAKEKNKKRRIHEATDDSFYVFSNIKHEQTGFTGCNWKIFARL